MASVYVLAFAIAGDRLRNHPQDLPVFSRSGLRFLVLVPAHNEESCIYGTLESLLNQQYSADHYKVVVIADNCTDATADVVRKVGVECWERQDPDQRGKGQALRWALDRAQALNFDAVAFVDADTSVGTAFLGRVAECMATGAKAVQARYDFALKDDHWFSVLTNASKSAEAALFWNPRRSFGLTCFIQGNGFAVRRDVLRDVPWTAFSIVEDIEYSLHLLLAGIRVEFLNETSVISRPTETVAHAFPQRLRWASGTLPLLVSFVPRLLAAGIAQRRLFLAEAAAALAFTSRMLVVYLLLLSSTLTVFALRFAYGTPALVALSFCCAAVLVQFVYLILVIRCASAKISVIKTLFYTPFYLAWLVCVQIVAATGIRRRLWHRTVR